MDTIEKALDDTERDESSNVDAAQASLMLADPLTQRLALSK